jgi:hypothetical protein
MTMVDWLRPGLINQLGFFVETGCNLSASQ